MDVTFLPSQEHLLIMGYARKIINSCRIKKQIGKFKESDKNNLGWTDAIDESQWKILSKKAVIVFSETIDPSQEGLRDRVVGVIRPICIEIQKWMNDHRYIEITDADIEKSLRWLNEGLIDRKMTAKVLVKNKNLPIQSRFELACKYCFMHYIECLWKCMSESEKRRYSGKHNQNNRIIDFWIKWVTTGSKKDLLLSPDRDFDQLCFNAYYTNLVALEYFLNLLTAEDKQQYLTEIAKEKYLIPSVMHFCLQKMDSNQIVEMFKKTPFKTLKCFLDFPWQNSFLVMALHIWPYLQENEFVCLIYFIIYERIVTEWNDYDYLHLLAEFYVQSPENFKLYVTQQDIFKVLQFIGGQLTTQRSLNVPDLHNYLKEFTLPLETEKRYKKACRSC